MSRERLGAACIMLGVLGAMAAAGSLVRDMLAARRHAPSRASAKPVATSATSTADRVRLEPPGKPAFFVDRTEVTVDAYRACVTAGACTVPSQGRFCNWAAPDHGSHPINCVDHEQAERYCAWVGARLPTDSEWDFAAYGEKSVGNPWGDSMPKDQDCFGRNVVTEGELELERIVSPAKGTCDVHAHPRGATPAGVLGLQGNVAEWLATDTRAEKPTDFAARGATWSDPWYRVRQDEALRRYAASYRDALLGFRCVR